MKKLKYLIAVVLALAMLVFTAACTRTIPLDTPDPASFVIDDEYNLYWKYVPAARSYTVRVTGVDQSYTEEIPSHYTHVSLAHLKEGDYELRVMAHGGSNNEVVSAWSEPKPMHRDHEAGVLYTPINANSEYAVSGVGSATGDVVIDAVYRGKPVTAIAEDAFRGKGNSRLTSIVIPEGVRSVGKNAFYNCTKLTSVTFPDSVTSLGSNLFQGCSSLASVTLPADITSIPAYTFAYCRQLTEISIPESVTSIGESAFYNCSSLTALDLPDSVTYIGEHAFDSAKAMTKVTFGAGIRTVDQFAFYKCVALTDIVFPEKEADAVTPISLSDSAFEGCELLAEADLPEGLTSIGANAFYNCTALETVHIPESVTRVGEYAFTNTALFQKQKAAKSMFIYADGWLLTWDVYPPEGGNRQDEIAKFTALTPDMIRDGTVGIADQAFLTTVVGDDVAVLMGPPKLAEVELKASIRYIGINAFYRSESLSKFSTETGSALTALGDYAFQRCTVLKNVQFSDGLRDIGSYAFYGCTMLTGGDYLVPSTVERIGTYAFMDSGIWERASEGDGIAYAGNWVVGFNLETKAQHDSFELKDVAGVADYAFYQNEEVMFIQNLESARHIGRGAFFGCVALTQISLNANLTEIADNTFSGCKSLFSIDFPIFIDRIGLRAFYDCTQLDAINLATARVKEIGDYAFYHCLNVKAVTFGTRSQLEKIGDYAFYGLQQITEISLPDTVTSIGANCFTGCSALTSVKLSENLERIGAGSFQRCEAIASVVIPENVTEIGGYAFYKCTSLQDVTFGSRVEHIGSYAFGATALTSVVLPASVKEIGDYAFKSTYSLTSVLMLGAPVSIGIHAFYGSAQLSFYIAADAAQTDTALWSGRWNSMFRPVVWGVTADEEGNYAASFTADFANIENPYARFGLTAPVREGYIFAGWATSPGGEAVYGVDEWRNAEPGTTLYAVWTEYTDAPDPEETPSGTPSETPEETEQN